MNLKIHKFNKITKNIKKKKEKEKNKNKIEKKGNYISRFK